MRAIPALLTLLLAAAPVAAQEDWRPLFPDSGLGAWTVTGGDGKYEREPDGALYGHSATGRNTFLVSPREYADFVLEVDVKIEPGGGNSGIQFRSHVREDGRLYGYQAEIDPSERVLVGRHLRRGPPRLARRTSKANDAARAAFKVGEWNTLPHRGARAGC